MKWWATRKLLCRNSADGERRLFYLAREVPGAYGFLGGQAPYGASNLHNPQFDFDDRVLSTGAALWVTIARRRLAASLIRQPIQSVHCSVPALYHRKSEALGRKCLRFIVRARVPSLFIVSSVR